MNIRVFWLLLFLLPAVSQQTSLPESYSAWKDLTPGIQYREFYLQDPNHLYVTRLERDNPQVTLETSLANGWVSGGLETVRGMVERYDQAINAWGGNWGTRNQVVAAVNGSFYDPKTGIPWSGIITSGWYAKRFVERENGSGFAWTMDRMAFIGGCVVHRSQKQQITNLSTRKEIQFDSINTPRGENDLVIYTPQYQTATQTDDKGLEVLVELEQPLMIMPSPAMVKGTVIQIYDGQGGTLIPFDAVVISASGTARERLKNGFKIGDSIGFSQEITHYEPDCQTPNPVSWLKTYASLGGSYVFLRDGVVQGINDLGGILLNPRTAIGYNDRNIFFIVVDGRDRFNSLGMSMVELGIFAKTMLGATWGIAQDGGGSSTMVVNKEVKNHPNAELIEEAVPEKTTPSAEGSSKTQIVERAVANGMMMVVVLPKEVSHRFKPDDQVIVTGSESVNVRLGPGTNYGVINTISPNSTGKIIDHAGKMNGVLAKGNYWWKVDFGAVVGWVSEDYLALFEP